MKLNRVVISVLACLKDVKLREKIGESYKLEIKPLKNWNYYIENEEFKKRNVTEANFEKCVRYSLKYLQDEKFLEYLESSEICFILFYKKSDNKDVNILKRQEKKDYMGRMLNTMVLKYKIEKEVLVLYIHPMGMYKEDIKSKKLEILKYFSENVSEVKELRIKYIKENTLMDDFEENLIDLGFMVE